METKMKKGILIDPETQTISEVEIQTWRDIAPLIGNGCTTFSCPVEFDNRDTMYCDDEGLYHDIKGGIMMSDWSYPIIGRVLILGTDEEGDTVDAKTPTQWFRENITYVTEQQAKSYAQFALATPFKVYTWE